MIKLPTPTNLWRLQLSFSLHYESNVLLLLLIFPSTFANHLDCRTSYQLACTYGPLLPIDWLWILHVFPLNYDDYNWPTILSIVKNDQSICTFTIATISATCGNFTNFLKRDHDWTFKALTDSKSLFKHNLIFLVSRFGWTFVLRTNELSFIV